MFKIIMFVRKKQDLSTEEFIKLWEAHSQKVINYKEALLIKDYAKTFPFQPTDEKSSTQRETLPFTFDAMGELWYESKDDFLKARNTPEGQKALADLRADELKFVDMANSVMWLGTEEKIFDKLPFEVKSWTVLDEYFYLSDYAGNSVADFDKLIALFSEDITMLSADGSQMKGKTVVISFFKQFFFFLFLYASITTNCINSTCYKTIKTKFKTVRTSPPNIWNYIHFIFLQKECYCSI